MNISIVIPNYNGKTLLNDLPKILHILEKYKNGKSELIITDDASTDGSLEMLHEFAREHDTSQVKIIVLENQSGKNKGFAINVNKGVAASTGEIVILLNTDVLPQEDFLRPLLSHFTDKNVFAVGCMDESKENGKVILRGRGIGKWKRGFLMHARGEVNQESTLWVSCGSGAFRKNIWEKLGGLNVLYSPFYWEDIDISYRAQKMGYKVLFENKSIVEHNHQTGSIKKHYSDTYVKTIAYRNQFFFTWLNATDKMLLVEHGIFLPYFLIKSLIFGDSAFFIGFMKAVGKLPKVLKEREKVQKLVKISDREVIAQIGS